jgi:hypothetical protein
MENRFIAVKASPTIIVGECPGRQRQRNANNQVFHGNRTGDFIEALIEGKSNIILTNANNFPASQSTAQGAFELLSLILKYQPKKVILLGRKARLALDLVIDPTMRFFETKCFDHPSYRLRFNRNVEEYRQELLKELE